MATLKSLRFSARAFFALVGKSRSSIVVVSHRQSSSGSHNESSDPPPSHFRRSPTSGQTPHQFYSRFSANRIMTGSDTVRISDYDYIGFDLDNTLLRYRVLPMMRLVHDALARHLIERHGMPADRLLRPFDEQLDFVQRGLIIDLKRGNVLKISPDGFIRRAAHGTRFLSDAEVQHVYGPERRWSMLEAYAGDLLHTWEGPGADAMRTLLDYFDMPLAVVFGRCIDTIDAGSVGLDLAQVQYDIWPAILEGLFALYSREHFQTGQSEYFEELKRNPAAYIHKTDPGTIEYLRQLRKTRTTFMLTGSNIDFANFTASYALGPDWRDLFDVVVCFAKKPGFFQLDRRFLHLDGAREGDPVPAGQLQLNGVYSQGNWPELLRLLQQKRGTAPLASPKILYIGDNLVQDVYAASTLSGFDTIAVLEELLAENGTADSVDARPGQRRHEAEALLRSNSWGSYFGSATDPTLWSDVIQRNAKLCVADVADLTGQPIDHEYRSFSADLGNCSKGYWPSEPRHFNE